VSEDAAFRRKGGKLQWEGMKLRAAIPPKRPPLIVKQSLFGTLAFRILTQIHPWSSKLLARVSRTCELVRSV
jgi:hypothetical protein